MGKKKWLGCAGFIGGGRITQIMLDEWQKDDSLPCNILVSDANPDVLKALKARHSEIEISAKNIKAAGCDIVFLALYPPVMGSTLEDIKAALKPDAILISLAPKWTIAKLSMALGGFNRIVRIIPNAPSVVGKGYNPLAFSSAITTDLKKEILRLFISLGDCPEVEEEKLEAYAILSAMEPTYFWFQMQKLRELGVTFGLTEKETDKALYEMVKGAAKTLFQSGLSYPDVVNLIPVKPLAEDEQNIIQAYETSLKGLHEKFKG